MHINSSLPCSCFSRRKPLVCWLLLTEFRFKAKHISMKVSENLPLSECHINSVSLSGETSYKASSRVLAEALRAPDSTECHFQESDGQRCWAKVHQVPPIELYERIKGFVKLCHKAVNHCHSFLIFMVLTTEEAPRAVVTMSITSFVKSFTSASTPESSRDNKEGT